MENAYKLKYQGQLAELVFLSSTVKETRDSRHIGGLIEDLN